MSSVYPPFGGVPVQRCLRCGTLIPANGVTCANCGTYNPVAQPTTFTDQRGVQWVIMQPQASLNGGQYSGVQVGQSIFSPPQNSEWMQLSSQPQQNLYSSPNIVQNHSSYSIPGQGTDSNINGNNMTPQQNANYFYPSTSYDI